MSFYSPTRLGRKPCSSNELALSLGLCRITQHLPPSSRGQGSLRGLASSRAGTTFASSLWIPAGPGTASKAWWPLPQVVPGLVGGEDSELSALTPGGRGGGRAIKEGDQQSAPWGRLILPEAQAEAFMEEVAFPQVLDRGRLAFGAERWAVIALG